MDYGRLETEKRKPASEELDELSVFEAAKLMHEADLEAAEAVGRVLGSVAEVAEEALRAFTNGGRLIYCGAGTSGRLGVLDASECVPTFGVPEDTVIGRIAGGDRALRYAVEGAEDDEQLGREDMRALNIRENDLVVAVSASGSAAYCRGALAYVRERGASAAGVCCVSDPAFAPLCDHLVCAVTGPEVLTGSTRLKAGTATKMILNMISTLSLAKTGKVYKNYMVDVVPSNKKLLDRAVRIVMEACGTGRGEAEALLEDCGGEIKTAIVCHETGAGIRTAREALASNGMNVRRAIKTVRNGAEPEG